MIQLTKEDDDLLGADVVRILNDEFDRWGKLAPREDLTLKILAHMTICAAIKARGFNGAITFLHTQVSEMVWAALVVEEVRQVSGSGETSAEK